MRHLVLAALFVTMSGVAGAQILTQRQFTDEVIADLQSDGAAGCVARLDDGGFTFGKDDASCNTMTVFTDRRYQDYVYEPEEKANIIGRLTGAARESIASAESGNVFPADYMESIVLVVRPDNYGNAVAAGNADRIMYRPLAGTLRAYIAFDSPTRLMAIVRDGMPVTGLSDDELFALAEENTRNRLGDLARVPDAGVTLVSAESGLAPSFLALPESCLAETPVSYALLPDGFSYAEADGADAAAVTQLARIGMYNYIRMGSGHETLLVCRDGQWHDANMQALVD